MTTMTFFPLYMVWEDTKVDAASQYGRSYNRNKNGVSRLLRDTPSENVTANSLLYQDHLLHVVEFLPGRKRCRLQPVEVNSGRERKPRVRRAVPLHGLVPSSDRPVDKPRDFLAENVVHAQPDVARLGQIVRDLRRRVERIRIVRMKREPGRDRHGQCLLAALDLQSGRRELRIQRRGEAADEEVLQRCSHRLRRPRLQDEVCEAGRDTLSRETSEVDPSFKERSGRE